MKSVPTGASSDASFPEASFTAISEIKSDLKSFTAVSGKIPLRYPRSSSYTTSESSFKSDRTFAVPNDASDDDTLAAVSAASVNDSSFFTICVFPFRKISYILIIQLDCNLFARLCQAPPPDRRLFSQNTPEYFFVSLTIYFLCGKIYWLVNTALYYFPDLP